MASIKEIAEDNDFNLNIPRYVDTFEEEEQISLESVAHKIESINVSMKSVNDDLSKYCKELEISDLGSL